MTHRGFFHALIAASTTSAFSITLVPREQSAATSSASVCVGAVSPTLRASRRKAGEFLRRNDRTPSPVRSRYRLAVQQFVQHRLHVALRRRANPLNVGVSFLFWNDFGRAESEGVKSRRRRDLRIAAMDENQG